MVEAAEESDVECETVLATIGIRVCNVSTEKNDAFQTLPVQTYKATGNYKVKLRTHTGVSGILRTTSTSQIKN